MSKDERNIEMATTSSAIFLGVAISSSLAWTGIWPKTLFLFGHRRRIAIKANKRLIHLGYSPASGLGS